MGIIAGATIGAGTLLTFFFIALVFFLYRRRKGSEYGPCSGRGPPGGPQQAGPGRGEGVDSGAPQARWVRKQPLQRLAESVQAAPPVPGRKDVTLRKLDIKVETVNREPLTMHSDREDDAASVSTATRVMKAIYSVRVPPPWPSSPHTLGTGSCPAHQYCRSLLPQSSYLDPAPSPICSHTYIYVHMHIHDHIHVPTLPRLISLHYRTGRWGLHRLPSPQSPPTECQNWKPLEVFWPNCLIAQMRKEPQKGAGTYPSIAC